MNNSTGFTPPLSVRTDTRTVLAVGGIMCVQFILASLGNLLVIVVIILKVPLGRKPINSLILSLAVADFLQAFCIQLPGVIQRFQQTWTMGSFVCKVYTTGRSIFAPAGLLIIALIGIERFRSLCKTDGVAFNIKTTRILILVVWIICLGAAIPMATLYEVTTYRGGYRRCAMVNESSVQNIIYAVVTRVLFFFIPLVLTWSCYMGVIHRMMKSSRKVAELQVNPSFHLKRQQTVIRVSRTCVLIAVVFTLCWTPFNIMLLYGTLSSDRNVPSMYQYAWLPAACASCINPFIYGLMMKPLRDGLLEIFRCRSVTENGSSWQGTHETVLSNRNG